MAIKKKSKTKSQEPVSKPRQKVLAITLGASLPAGTIISDEVYTDLIGAGFTDEQLFGKQ